MNATTLVRFKEFEKLVSTTYDSFLNNHIKVVTRQIEKYLKTTLGLSSITEILNGSGTDELILNNRPVRKLTKIEFSDTEQTLTNYAIKNKGIIYTTDSSTFPEGYKNIKAYEYSGYESIYISFHSTSLSLTVDSVVITISIDPGEYLVEDLITAINDAIEDEIDGDEVILSYIYNDYKFKFTATGVTLSTTFADDNNSFHNDLGFADTNLTGETTYTGDREVIPLPDDITFCANQMLKRYFEKMIDKDRFDIKKKDFDKGGTIEYDNSDLLETLKLYRIISC